MGLALVCSGAIFLVRRKQAKKKGLSEPSSANNPYATNGYISVEQTGGPQKDIYAAVSHDLSAEMPENAVAVEEMEGDNSFPPLPYSCRDGQFGGGLTICRT